MTNLRSSLTVLVTDAHELAGMGAARALGRAGYRVIAAVSMQAESPAVSASRYIAECITLPDAWRDLDEFAERILRRCEHGSIGAILPVSEAATYALMRHRQRIASVSRLIMASDAALNVTLSKHQSIARAIACGIETPATWFVCDGSDSDASEIRAVRYPCILKSDNVAAQDGSYYKGRAWRCEGPGDLLAALDECLSVHAPAVAQELVPGRGVGAFVFRRSGETIAAMTHERLHEVPYTGGWSSYRVATANAAVRARAERLLTSIDFDGLAMVEFRQNHSGTPFFIEINGRLWGSIALALHSGCDFPTIAADAAFGLEPSHPGQPRVGTRCVNLFPGEFGYLASLIRSASRSEEARSLRVLRGAGETLAAAISPTVRGDFFWRDDPAPGLVQCHNMLRFVLQRTVNYARSRVHRWRRRARASAAAAQLPGAVSCILILCSGNICRSPFAERLLRQQLLARGVTDVSVFSAGLHAKPGERLPLRFQRLMERLGVDLSDHRSKAVNVLSVLAADAVLVMESAHLEETVARFPEAAGRTMLLAAAGCGEGSAEIPDPYVQSAAEAANTFSTLAHCVRRIAEKIAAQRIGRDALRSST